MKHISNEKKAREIARGLNFSSDYPHDYKSAFDGAILMGKWKNEQFAAEKQKLIDEACEWLAKNDSYAIPTNVQVDRLREYLNNIMKGE